MAILKEEDALDSSVSLTQRSLTDLGTIRVLLRACEVMEETLRPAVESTKDYTLPGDAPISEKSKKAGAHASKYVYPVYILYEIRFQFSQIL